MKHRELCIVGVLVTVVASAQQRDKPAAPEDRDWTATHIAGYTRDKWLVILDAEHDFYSAKREAERISKLSRFPFSMRGLEFEPRRGLVLPDKGDDAPDAGRYMARRYNEDAENPRGYISIERSDGYPGLRQNLYIVVGAICDSSSEANTKLRQFQPFARLAYAAKTQIYMGCIH
jgi:hypothetical protein